MRGGPFYSLGGYSNYKENEFNNEDSEDDTEDENALEDESDEEEGKEEDIDDNSYVTIGFTVLKLKRYTKAGSKDRYKWVKVHSLGDQALFVGDKSSMSLSASSFNGCKANCIYLTDDHKLYYVSTLNGGGNDIGVFSKKDGKIELLLKDDITLLDC
ncbi:f-box protein [Quercus suber]|uniref:F-box protein n=1 Tax=Quercus suber TaxID=58331 RepID=A0AAW0LJP2_QUESU